MFLIVVCIFIPGRRRRRGYSRHLAVAVQTAASPNIIFRINE